jgi:hypothetical protein
MSFSSIAFPYHQRLDLFCGLMLFLLSQLVLSQLAAAKLTAADAWDTAKARHSWTWFALTEAQAEAEARRQGCTLVVEQRDGQPPKSAPAQPAGPTVKVYLRDERVLWAMMTDGKTMRAEGVSDVALLTWLGLTEADALTQVRAAGRAVRVIARDDEHFPVTLDYNADRLNLQVRKGVVVAITSG